MREQLLRELQLKAGERVPEWQDLLFVEGGAATGTTLTGSLQHHPSTLFVQLQITSAGNMATRNENSVWRNVKRSTPSTSLHPRRRPDADKNQWAPLPIRPVQKIGHSIRTFAVYRETSFQFCAEPFNLTNRHFFAVPASSVASPTFGIVSAAANTPRQRQFAFKFQF